jgi:nicotinate-nucleotide adenylyltransferase
MSKNIILFGGSFDPPHIGHLSTAAVALERTGSDGLWFIPCYSDAFGQKNLSDVHHRVVMTDLMLKDFPTSKFHVCEREVEMANQAGTYAVIRDLMRTYPNYNFKYLIGLDQAQRIREWRNSRDLLRTIPFIVIKRVGLPDKTTLSWYYDKPHTYIDVTVNKNKMSSSNIRFDFMKYRHKYLKVCHPNLTESVNSYIIENDLYQIKI